MKIIVNMEIVLLLLVIMRMLLLLTMAGASHLHILKMANQGRTGSRQALERTVPLPLATLWLPVYFGVSADQTRIHKKEEG